MPTTLKDESAICGIGQTEFSKNSGRSELQLACEATKAAILDAGLSTLCGIEPGIKIIGIPRTAVAGFHFPYQVAVVIFNTAPGGVAGGRRSATI